MYMYMHVYVQHMDYICHKNKNILFIDEHVQYIYIYMVWMCLCDESLTSCVIGTVIYLKLWVMVVVKGRSEAQSSLWDLWHLSS